MVENTVTEDAIAGPIENMDRATLLQLVAYYQAQDGLLSQAQDQVVRLQAQIDEIERPLDAQMARLNSRVIDLTAQRDSLSMTLSREVARLEVAPSLLGSGFEFGMHRKAGTTCTVKSGTLRSAIDAARVEFPS